MPKDSLKIITKLNVPPEPEGEKSLRMTLEQKETESPVLYDKKTNGHERGKHGEEAQIGQSINK